MSGKQMKLAAIIMAVFCGISLHMWYQFNYILVEPIMAIMGLVSSPFFYWMGVIAQKGGK